MKVRIAVAISVFECSVCKFGGIILQCGALCLFRNFECTEGREGTMIA